jgi:hypothetical protein
MYSHRAKYEQNQQATSASYANGTVIGVWLDLEKKIMQWSFNGKIEKPAAFTNVPEGPLFPAISFGNGEIQINFGLQPFKFHPNEPASTAASSALSETPKHGSAPAPLSSLSPTPLVDPPAAVVNFFSGHSPTEVFWSPLDHPLLNTSASFFEQLDVAYSLLNHLADRTNTMDQETITAAVAQEIEMLQQDTPLNFEYVETDANASSFSGGFGAFGRTVQPAVLLQDNQQNCTFYKTRNAHITFQLAETAAASGENEGDAKAGNLFLLKEVTIRAASGSTGGFGSFGLGGSSNNSTNNSVFGLIFLSDTKPADFEMFEWCNDFKLASWKRWKTRKEQAAGGGPVTYFPHEPVGFIHNTMNSVLVTLHCDPTAIRPAKFVTLKLSNCHSANGSMILEHIKFSGILNSHPLSAVHGTKAAADKIEEIRQQLIRGAKEKVAVGSEALTPTSTAASSSSSSVLSPLSATGSNWSLAQDEALVALLQTLATRTGVSPLSLDAVGAFRPTATDLARYTTILKNVSLDSMRSRVTVLKYANKQAAPLLSYCHATESRKPFKGEPDEEEVKNGNNAPNPNKEARSVGVVPQQLASATGAKDSSPQTDTSLSATVRHLKGLYFLSTKKTVFESLLTQANPANKGAVGGFASMNIYQPPRITVNRIKASRLRDEGTIREQQGSVFHQIFAALKSQPPKMFRMLNADQQVWNVSFQGEGSIDVGQEKEDEGEESKRRSSKETGRERERERERETERQGSTLMRASVSPFALRFALVQAVSVSWSHFCALVLLLLSRLSLLLFVVSCSLRRSVS